MRGSLEHGAWYVDCEGVKRGPVLGIQRIKGFCRLYSSMFWAREQVVSLKHGVCPLDRRLVSLLLSGVVDQVEVSSGGVKLLFVYVVIFAS